MTTDARPDPDELLARAHAAQQRAARGTLKVFFGASAGVGKTYAMLEAAQVLRAQHVDVVVGIVETHGRAETAGQLESLERLPLRSVPIKDRELFEFDLDAALARKPAVLLVDELAHSNAPGSRHPKRWQDIEELLAAGVNVITTVNVQHLESLNDVVGGITGIRVSETVPDHVFDDADEVELVDLPTEDLLQRLQDGKVYLPAQARQAVQNFFRKGNLMALRELALRRTADRIDDDVRSYRREHMGIEGKRLWQTSDALLVCIGPAPGADKLVRAAGRRANRSTAPWHAVYVETPALQRLPDAQRSAILKTLKLAESLGAVTATLSGDDAALAAAAYAHEHNLGTVVCGHAPRASAWLGRTTFADRVTRHAAGVELMVIPTDAGTRPGPRMTSDPPAAGRWIGHAWALAACAAVSLLATPLLAWFDPANIVMLYLLALVLVAVRFGRGAALTAAVLNVLAFDFFFVTPRFSFAVSDAQYLLTFAVMMIVGLVVGQLTASLRYQARVATDREDRSRRLYEIARELGKALTTEQVAAIGDRALEAAFRAKAAVMLIDAHDRLALASDGVGGAPAIDTALAQWAFDHADAAGAGTDTLPASAQLYVPLIAPMRTRGVIVIEPANARLLMIPEQRQLLDTYATLIAMAIERVHFVSVAQETLVSMESERLRNSLLAALSHDLRTPLTALAGTAETLAQSLLREGSAHARDAHAITVQAHRTTQLVNNLLDMARLQAGAVTLRRDWQSLEELAGSALRSVESALASHRVVVALPDDLPLLYADGVLIERVLANLFENAAKYTPAGSTITLSAHVDGAHIVVDVTDDGPGLPPGDAEALFDKFRRGDKESSTPGVGLGLAICRAIVQAHGGTISAHAASPHGAVLRWTLPYKPVPAVPPQ
ncbi:MAG: two-component system sensor histidine kinase KdpD [Burkholderiales bacterium]